MIEEIEIGKHASYQAYNDTNPILKEQMSDEW